MAPLPLEHLKSWVRRNTPRLTPWFSKYLTALTRQARDLRSPRAVFTHIWARRLWGPGESVSGEGSSLSSTIQLRAALSALLKTRGVRTLLDAPCGDFNWMRETDLSGIQYLGVDIVPELVRSNAKLYQGQDRTFLVADICTDVLPRAELILCRHCFIHLSFRRIQAALRNFQRSGAEYLLVTTNPTLEQNVDIESGSFRELNLAAAPFHFPPPLQFLPDVPGSPAGLALYRLRDLPT